MATKKILVIPAGIAGIQMPRMASLHNVPLKMAKLSILKRDCYRSHPFELDSGNPCRNDGVFIVAIFIKNYKTSKPI
jgi:hypothetical protein